MAVGNAVNISTAGIQGFDGTSAFNGSAVTQHSILLGGANNHTITNLGVATNGQIAIGSTGADPVLTTISAGAGVTVTNGAGSITLTAMAGGLTWNGSGIAFTAVSGNGYFISGLGVTATLPSGASLGATVAFGIVTITTGNIIQASGTDQIRIGTALSSAGGTAVNHAEGDTLFLVFDGNGVWVAINVIGTWSTT